MAGVWFSIGHRQRKPYSLDYYNVVLVSNSHLYSIKGVIYSLLEIELNRSMPISNTGLKIASGFQI